MKKKSVLIGVLAAHLLFAGAVYAASGTISGVVKDMATGSAIAGAAVHAGTQSAITNSSGSYTLTVKTGGYTLSTSASGYLTTSQIVTVGAAGVSVNWALTKSYGNQAIPAANMSYVVLAWNDLGMHCDQDDYSYFAVLPPFNTLHAQVFRHGGDSGLVTSGITVSYAFPKKTNSALHTNFWTYAPQFGWNVPANVGITGTPLAGTMTLDSNGVGFVATGIPITPYDDDGTWDPYGTAVLTVRDSSGNVLQTANVVAPVSTEMMCSNCHGSNPQLDILLTHDRDNATTLYDDWTAGKVHLCAECHSSNALGAPGKSGVESLTLAMHNFHKDKMQYSAAAAATTPDCYNCHPGPKTECLRGIMSRAGKSCHDCHGDMSAMASSLQAGRQGWLQEPQCGNCHDASHAENSNTLYRNSLLQNGPTSDMNNKIYCEACHNSPHGEYTTANAADTSITRKFQGDDYWIWNCNVCHSSMSQRSMHSGTSSSGSHGSRGNDH